MTKMNKWITCIEGNTATIREEETKRLLASFNEHSFLNAHMLVEAHNSVLTSLAKDNDKLTAIKDESNRLYMEKNELLNTIKANENLCFDYRTQISKLKDDLAKAVKENDKLDQLFWKALQNIYR